MNREIYGSPADQAERERFTREHARNISVIAPAGVGKTYGIVQRIVHLARLPESEAIDRLARLAVVTYSVRAAQEMQQRARAEIRRAGLPLRVQRAFQRTFFGTIHSFCLQLLGRFGHYLGLPGGLELPASEDELWNRFLVRGLRHEAADLDLQDLFHFYTAAQLYGLGRTLAPDIAVSPGPMPRPDVRALLAFPLEGLKASTRRAAENARESLRVWDEAWTKGDRFHPLPDCPARLSAPDFVALWRDVFTSLNDWLRRGALAFGRRVAQHYEEFRLAEGVMNYDDQIRLALRLLDAPAVQREVAQERWSILLDEAQDTDARQFELLLRVAGLRPERRQAPGQTMAIVGDFQQAIFSPRSDLRVYQAVHEEIAVEPHGVVSQLQVTFRCDRAIIDFVNAVFDPLLDAAPGQAKFSRLQPRDGAGEGRVVRWNCPATPESTGRKKVARDAAENEAGFLAAELARRGAAGFGAVDWSEVAILCPRIDWLKEIQRALAAAGVPAQIHSNRETLARSTPRAWLTALVWIAAHPEDDFEMVGVLRDLFGVSDHDLALFTGGNGEVLRLDRPSIHRQGPVGEALALLTDACRGIDSLPLHHAVRRLAEKVRLRDRLVSVGEGTASEIERELDELLTTAGERSAAGETLIGLANAWREALDRPAPGEEEIGDAVQLCTSQKAKGLEWTTVLVPYVFRSIGLPSPTYPRVETDPNDGPVVYRNGIDFEAGAKEAVARRERQQLQRLLYVTCTRARRTLIFIDDEVAFAGLPVRGISTSARLLGFDQDPARAIWRALPENLSLPPADVPIPTPAPEPRPAPRRLTLDHVARAKAQAERIVRRITPHALARPSPAEAEPERIAEREEHERAIANQPGIRYGTWWHATMEEIPWGAVRVGEREAAFARALRTSPDPDRAREEWALFGASRLAAWLDTPELLIQREMPFLWLANGEEAVEGVIDLAILSSRENAWHLIDWKTNRVEEENATPLIETYRPQIEAYARALAGLLGAPVRGSLYFTATGNWVELESTDAAPASVPRTR